MLRIGLGVIAGFFTWAIVWFGSETIISSIWPAFGEHQAAFQEVIERGLRAGHFYPNPTFLFVHCVLASLVSIIAGIVASLIANDNRRAPLILGFLLLCVGLLKAAMSWPYVPVWYHILFTALLLPMTVIGGRLKGASS